MLPVMRLHALFCLTAVAAFGHGASLRHIESGGIGYDCGYTTLEMFLSSDPEKWSVTPFLDARGHVFDDGKWAANAGIGLRSIRAGRVYGINTYYDYRNTRRLHYNQIGLGLETLGEFFDFRINGYLPVGRKLSSPYAVRFGEFSGNYLLLSQKYQFAMKGADAEFGFHFEKSGAVDLYAAAGPYYYVGEIGPGTWGAKARIRGTYKNILGLELSNSYDNTFHNRFQGQISLSFALGPKSDTHTCTMPRRMMQPVGRDEIIVVNKKRRNEPAIDPATGQPYIFVFVDNTSRSNGTFESPYHTLAQAEANSNPYNIIYVFPGDGTTTGMDSGIFLKANQKLWGSGISQSIQTSQGTISIPAQSSSSPTITNTNIDTEGNAVTLATNNAISGLIIASASNDAIHGTDPQSLEISSCLFRNTTTFTVNATFSGDASISVTNNQFLNNVNGIFLTLNGTSTVVCTNNTFQGQTSVSSSPIEISTTDNVLTAHIDNNTFNSNIVGSVRLALNSVSDANISLLNNTITNNGTGSQGSGLGSSFVINPSGTTRNASILLEDNTFSANTSNSLYIHTSGAFTTLGITASGNTMSDNGGSAIVFASACTTFTLNATNNTFTRLNDNGINISGETSFQTANITINENSITDITNNQNGIAIGQGSSTLALTVENNTINRCDGSGILCYASEFTNMTANITNNVINNCQNNGGNAASAISLDTYVNLASTVTNNSLSDNADPGVGVGVFTAGNPAVCLTLSGNTNSATYTLTNPGSGAFNLAPCNATTTANTGTVNTSGTTSVQSCPGATACP